MTLLRIPIGLTRKDFRAPTSSRSTALIAGAIILLLLIILIGSPIGTVGAGERGIQLRFDAVTGKVLGEGLYFRWPIIERVIKLDIKVQKEQVDATAASKDLQTVNSNVALNFHLNPETVATIYQEVGVDYKTRIIDPTLQEAVKAVSAKFTAEELITRRESVRDEVKVLLHSKARPPGHRGGRVQYREFRLLQRLQQRHRGQGHRGAVGAGRQE